MNVKVFILALSVPLFVSGCSVVMAAHESESIDKGVLARGTHRSKVEKVLTNKLQEGGSRSERIATYQYFSGDEASYGRAAVYGLLDILTVGLAEIATTPVEALQGNKHIVTVVYDSHGKLLRYSERTEQAPLEKPEKMLGLEEIPSEVAPVHFNTPEPKLPDSRRASL